MLQQIIDFSIPVLVFALAFIVGMELSLTDFHRLAKSPKIIVAGTAGQIVFIPLCGMALVYLMDPPAGTAIGMLLLAVCPGGALSNFYIYVLKGNVALSVTMTVLSTILSVFYISALGAWGLAYFGYAGTGLETPVTRIVIQLALFVLLPVALGMGFRVWKAELAARSRKGLQGAGMAGIAAIVIAIFFKEQDGLMDNLASVAPLAISFTCLAMAVGYTIGIVLGAASPDRLVLMVEYAVRNIAIAIMLATNFGGQTQADLFAASYFVIHVPLIVLSAFAVKRLTQSEC